MIPAECVCSVHMLTTRASQLNCSLCSILSAPCAAPCRASTSTLVTANTNVSLCHNYTFMTCHVATLVTRDRGIIG